MSEMSQRTSLTQRKSPLKTIMQQKSQLQTRTQTWQVPEVDGRSSFKILDIGTCMQNKILASRGEEKGGGREKIGGSEAEKQLNM